MSRDVVLVQFVIDAVDGDLFGVGLARCWGRGELGHANFLNAGVGTGDEIGDGLDVVGCGGDGGRETLNYLVVEVAPVGRKVFVDVTTDERRGKGRESHGDEAGIVEGGPEAAPGEFVSEGV